MSGPLIRTVELRKTYTLGGAGVHALYNLSLEINIGEAESSVENAREVSSLAPADERPTEYRRNMSWL
jgi:hypothetical protein